MKLLEMSKERKTRVVLVRERKEELDLDGKRRGDE